MIDGADDRPAERWRPLLRRADQASVAVIVGASLLAMAWFWFQQGGHRGELLEFERADPQFAAFQVDINSAGWPELTLLPDIGESLARRIVESREAQGPFVDHEDLRRVKGIGPKTLDRIRPYLLPMPAAANVAGP